MMWPKKYSARKFVGWLLLLAAVLSAMWGGYELEKYIIREGGSMVGQQEGSIQGETSEGEIKDLYKVAKVIDGDTFDVERGEEKFRVRMLGVNTPELSDKRAVVKCQANKAKVKTEEMIGGKEVGLDADTIQGDMDNFGRKLRFVAIDGKDVGLELIKLGFANYYSRFPTERSEEYKQAEVEAKINNLGLWGGKCE